MNLKHAGYIKERGVSKEIFPLDKIFHRCCGFLLALFGSLFCSVFVFGFFFLGGGGVLCFVFVLVSFLFFSVFQFFCQNVSVEGKPSPDPK